VKDGHQVPKGYKQTEVGVIPEGWDTATIRQIASLVRNAIVGGPFGSDLVSRDYVDEGVPVIRGQNMGAKFVAGGFVFVTLAKANSLEANLARPGDLVFTQRGTLGQVSLVPKIPFARYIVSQSQMKLTVNLRAANPGFFYYVFSSGAQQELIRENTIQTGVPHINLGILREIPIQVPPIKEQEAIAEALSDADAFIESLEQLLAKKRQIKQGAMQELLTAKRRLPGFSGEWKVKSLNELFVFSGGFTASREQLSSEGYCYLHYGDIHISKKSFVNVRSEYQDIPKLNVALQRISPTSLLDDGDVVFVDASEDDEGTSKHVVVTNPDGIPFISGLHTIVAKCKSDALDHQYLRYCFQTAAIKAQFRFFAVGTKVSGINKTNIAKITLPLPMVSEQTAIAIIISDMDAEITELEDKLAKARNLKQGMMQDLLTGRIRLV
jgi:type I restriction enzyme, S subunit